MPENVQKLCVFVGHFGCVSPFSDHFSTFCHGQSCVYSWAMLDMCRHFRTIFRHFENGQSCVYSWAMLDMCRHFRTIFRHFVMAKVVCSWAILGMCRHFRTVFGHFVMVFFSGLSKDLHAAKRVADDLTPPAPPPPKCTLIQRCPPHQLCLT